jgi:hypothetical protein
MAEWAHLSKRLGRVFPKYIADIQSTFTIYKECQESTQNQTTY